MPPEERLEKSPRHHEWVEIGTQSHGKVRALVVYPEVDKAVPGIVVIHENRGLNEWARSLTDQLAEAGYVAVAPDMLSGQGPQGGGTDSFESPDAARTAIYALSDQKVRDILDATVKYVRNLEATTDTVAVAGFCWGGGKAFDYAAHQPNIAAAFVFYGSAPGDETMKQIKVPVYGFYGGDDFRITGEVPKVAAKMKELGKTFEPATYQGAGHGFMRSGEADDASQANRKARNEAWKRWLEILSRLEQERGGR
jgi:carboxymethylenebutenolidase